MRRMMAWMALCCAFSLLWGCPPKDKRETASPPPTLLVVKRISIHDQTPLEFRPATVTVEELRSLARSSLKAQGFQLDSAMGSTHWSHWSTRAQNEGKPIDSFFWTIDIRLHALYGIQTKDGMSRVPSAGQVKSMLRGDVALRPPGRTEAFYVHFDLLQTQAYDPLKGAVKPIYNAHFKTMLSMVTDRIKTNVVVYEKPVESLIDLVNDPSPDVRLAVVQRLSMTREEKAVPAIAQQLKHEKNRDIAHRMIGALAEIGDDKAAEALIHLANPRDRETLSAILDALTVVGGQRVEDFFGILSMHDASDIREMVEDAQRRWKRRQKIGSDRSK